MCHYLFCKYVPLQKFRVTTKKFTIFWFVYMVILNPSSFSALDIFFLSLSRLSLFGFLMIIRPSSLYSHVSVLLIMFDSWDRIRVPTSSHTYAHRSYPWLRRTDGYWVECTRFGLVWLSFVLWHINPCRSFIAKSFLYIYIKYYFWAYFLITFLYLTDLICFSHSKWFLLISNI